MTANAIVQALAAFMALSGATAALYLLRRAAKDARTAKAAARQAAETVRAADVTLRETNQALRATNAAITARCRTDTQRAEAARILADIDQIDARIAERESLAPRASR